MEVSAVILAAGRGERMKESANKVYLPLLGAPVLSYSLRAFAETTGIDEIVIVTRKGEEGIAARIARDIAPPVRIVPGGERRQDSARAGAEAAGGRIVLIHDAARPFPSSSLIGRVIECVERHGACVPAVPVADTVRYTDAEGFLRTERIDRRWLLRMQTPQGFLRDRLLSALAVTVETVTDDASAVLAAGGRVATVPGEETNIKLTTKGDLLLGEALLQAGLVAHEDRKG